MTATTCVYGRGLETRGREPQRETNARTQAVRSRMLFLGRLALVLSALATSSAEPLLAQEITAQETTAQETVVSQQEQTNDVVIELFYRSDSEQSLNAEQFLHQLSQKRNGIRVKTYDVLEDSVQLKRLWQLSKRFRYEKAGLPTFYLCDSLKVGFADKRLSGSKIEQLLTIKAYVRPGCKHCEAGRRFLDNLTLRWPALRIQYYDVVADSYARTEVQKLAARHRVRVASFPCIHAAGRLVVGFQSEEITGRKIEAFFQDRSSEAQEQTTESSNPAKAKTDEESTNHVNTKSDVGVNGATDSALDLEDPAVALALFGLLQLDGEGDAVEEAPQLSAQEIPQEIPLEVPLETDALPEDQAIRLPDDALPPDSGDEEAVILDDETDEIEVPVLGLLSVSKLGLPMFTFLIGLVDGFNPCAMWVLVFLLSVLVNIKDRKKIVVVAGTFVVVSGLAYFAFMAAWFSVFQFIGFLRPVQIGLGVLAIVIGVVNIKDFFYFHQGISFSIPESAKPGIYRRVRGIVSANHLTTALFGAIVLAVLVNIVELLCTAGLPALYTEILSLQNLPPSTNYAYLGLYITAYMLDDAILVAIVVSTLSRRKLQEREGRWLKLMSGCVILLLGGVMIFRPSLLI